jgi:hypothetical protein
MRENTQAFSGQVVDGADHPTRSRGTGPSITAPQDAKRAPAPSYTSTMYGTRDFLKGATPKATESP